MEQHAALDKMLFGRNSGENVPNGILNSDKIEIFMDDKNYVFHSTYGDGVAKYYPCLLNVVKHHVHFSRDWTKRGYFHVPYKMSIVVKKNRRVFQYRVHSVGQMKKALEHWQENHGQEKKKKACGVF